MSKTQSPSQKRRAEKQKKLTKAELDEYMGASRAKDLRIGEAFGHSRDKNGDRPRIKALAELCTERPTPHVHVTTNEGIHCLGFEERVR